jgi:hypothetical protein
VTLIKSLRFIESIPLVVSLAFVLRPAGRMEHPVLDCHPQLREPMQKARLPCGNRALLQL